MKILYLVEQQQDYLAQGIDVLGQTMGQAIQDESLRQMRMGNLRQLQQMILQEPNFGMQQVDVKTPDPAKIGYIYDFESIFANPQQEALFGSPYAEGGYVEDSNDELLRLLEGK